MLLPGMLIVCESLEVVFGSILSRLRVLELHFSSGPLGFRFRLVRKSSRLSRSLFPLDRSPFFRNVREFINEAHPTMRSLFESTVYEALLAFDRRLLPLEGCLPDFWVHFTAQEAWNRLTSAQPSTLPAHSE